MPFTVSKTLVLAPFWKWGNWGTEELSRTAINCGEKKVISEIWPVVNPNQAINPYSLLRYLSEINWHHLLSTVQLLIFTKVMSTVLVREQYPHFIHKVTKSLESQDFNKGSWSWSLRYVIRSLSPYSVGNAAMEPLMRNWVIRSFVWVTVIL